jgi:outer membrane protein TolC
MRIFIIFFGLTFVSNLGKAQIICPAELTQLVNQSFTFFPKIKEVENEVLSSKEKLAVNNLNKNPDIGFTGSYNFVMPKISFPINGKEIQFAPINNLNGTIGTSYTLFDFGRFKANITKTKSELQFSETNVDAAKNELAYQVAAIYFDIIF